MRIAVTGRCGQVARSLQERGAAHGHEVVALARPHCDLAAPETIAPALARARPDLVVSAAAHTAVDRAEAEPELAHAINAQGAAGIAVAAARLGVPLIHLSTDYVFDGRAARPWREDDIPCPQTVYGASKLAGEAAVLAAGGDATILRVAWVYSPFGANFVKTMLRLAEAHEEVMVVDDQTGNPTSALDIADGILRVAERLVASDEARLRGVFHMSGAGEASWAQFAGAIFAASRALGGPAARVRPIASGEYPSPATRPANSRLDCGLLAQVHGVRLPDWRPSLGEVVARILEGRDQAQEQT